MKIKVRSTNSDLWWVFYKKFLFWSQGYLYKAKSVDEAFEIALKKIPIKETRTYCDCCHRQACDHDYDYNY